MDKKQISVIAIIEVLAFELTTCIMYLMANPINNTTAPKNKDEFTVGIYTIRYGKYKGIEEQYDYDNDTIIKKEHHMELTSSIIKSNGNSYTYTIIGYKLVDSTGFEIEDFCTFLDCTPGELIIIKKDS